MFMNDYARLGPRLAAHSPKVEALGPADVLLR